MINKKNLKKNKGFSLLEIVITTAIFVVIMIVISSFARDIFYFDNIFSSGLTSYDNARKILQPVASEIRSASASSLGAYPLEITNENEFSFFTDINNDGLKEKIRYYLLGQVLMKGIISPTGNPLQYLSANETNSEIIKGVINNGVPVFTYYDNTYNGTNAPLVQPVSVFNVRLVNINLIIDENPNRPPAPINITTEVNLRNLKDNL